MKGGFNTKLEEGDRVMLYHMEGETSVIPGTFGTVVNISFDPFEKDEEEKIYRVKWDNGSTLSLLSATDVWKKVEDKQLKESDSRSQFNFVSKNIELFDMFDWKFLREYLTKIRDSGIINMFGAAPLLYSGKEHIDRYYGENPPNQEAFDEVLEMADDAKNKMIQGTLKYMKSKNMEIEIDRVNNVIGKLSRKMLELYIHI